MKMNGRHEETRTPDLYRVKREVSGSFLRRTVENLPRSSAANGQLYGAMCCKPAQAIANRHCPGCWLPIRKHVQCGSDPHQSTL
jgi:hypothetical protein